MKEKYKKPQRNAVWNTHQWLCTGYAAIMPCFFRKCNKLESREWGAVPLLKCLVRCYTGFTFLYAHEADQRWR